MLLSVSFSCGIINDPIKDSYIATIWALKSFNFWILSSKPLIPLFKGSERILVSSLKYLETSGILVKDPSPFLTKSFRSFFFSPNLFITNPLANALLEAAKAPSTAPSTPFRILNIGVSISVNPSKKFNFDKIVFNFVSIWVNSLLLSSNFLITLSIRDINLL